VVQEACSAYYVADFQEADRQIDKILADEIGTAVANPSDLPEDLPGNGPLLVLEKAMAQLGLERVDAAHALLVKAREVLDQRFSHNAFDYVESSFTDDETLTYRGADADHVFLRVLLTLCELLRGGSDAYSFALQIDAKQEEIIDSPFGTVEDEAHHAASYRPRAQYQRIALGSYLVGLLEEADLAAGEANKKFKRARQWWGSESVLLQDAIARTEPGGRLAPAGHGAVNVLYLAGRGPTLTTTRTSAITDAARLIGAAILAIRGKSTGAGWVSQTNIPVPGVIVHDSAVTPLDVHVGSERVGSTSPLLDVNRVATEQLDANMPWILARAAIRRALKGGIAEGGGAVAESVARRSEGAGAYAGVIGLFTKIAVGLATTAPERADTRIWSTLPAQVQCARFVLPEGVHEVDLGGGMQARLRVRAGRNTFVVVLRPGLDRAGTVLVDKLSEPGGGAVETELASAGIRP
jgi:hypothetical protein